MLYRLIIQNYKSFNEPVEFNMFPNNKRTTMTNHVYDCEPISVLKSSAIYGSNGAGKSNFIHAFLTLRDFATNRGRLSKEWYERSRFLLKENVDDSPISFLIEFSVEGTMYLYLLSVDGQGIKEENLYLSGAGKSEKKLIFSRSYGEVNFGNKKISKEIKLIVSRYLNAENNGYVSLLHFLAENQIIDDKRITDAFHWMNNQLEVLTPNYQIPRLISLLSENPEMMDFVNAVFAQLSLGINELRIKTESFDEWFNNEGKMDFQLFKMQNGFPNTDNFSKMEATSNDAHLFAIENKDGKKLVQTFLFNQLGQNGYTRDMNVRSQSDGTLRLLTLLPAIYRLIKEESVFIIDEINNNIHPILIRNLIRFFCEFKTKGQLIFTTHETELMRYKNVLRPDEMWIADKIEGQTTMYSINDFKYHKTMSVVNGYMEGRFRGIPEDTPISYTEKK